jgi:hypothetical protein
LGDGEVNYITLVASRGEHAVSYRAIDIELRRSTPRYRVHYFMQQVLHHYRDETILLKMIMFDGSTHSSQNVQATDKNLQGIADQWVKHIEGALA